MNHDEIVDLLTLAAVYDQRTGGSADVEGWYAVAQLEHWTFPVAKRVVIEHYSRGADRQRITPAAISDAIRTVRRKAADSFVAPNVPDHIMGRDYPEWFRAQRDRHISYVLAGWVLGEPIPEPSALDHQLAIGSEPNLTTCPPRLREQFARDLAKAGRVRPAIVQRRDTPRCSTLDDPGRREIAYAELEALKARLATQERGALAAEVAT